MKEGRKRVFKNANDYSLGVIRHQDILVDKISEVTDVPYIKLGSNNIRTVLIKNALRTNYIYGEEEKRFVKFERFYRGAIVTFSLSERRIYIDYESLKYGFYIDFGQITNENCVGISAIGFLNGDVNIGAFVYASNDYSAKLFLYFVRSKEKGIAYKNNKYYYQLKVKAQIIPLSYNTEGLNLFGRHYNFKDLYQNYARITSYNYIKGSHFLPIKTYLFYNGNPYAGFNFNKLDYAILGQLPIDLAASYNNNFNEFFSIHYWFKSYYIHFKNNNINYGWYPIGVPGIMDEATIFAVGGQNITEENIKHTALGWSGYLWNNYENGSYGKWIILRWSNNESFNHINTDFIYQNPIDADLIFYKNKWVGIFYLYQMSNYNYINNLGSWNFNRNIYGRLILFANLNMGSNGIYYQFLSLDRELYSESFLSNQYALGTYCVKEFVKYPLQISSFLFSYASHFFINKKPQNIEINTIDFIYWALDNLRISIWDPVYGVYCNYWDWTWNNNHVYMFNENCRNNRGAVYMNWYIYSPNEIMENENIFYPLERPDKQGGGLELKIPETNYYALGLFKGDICLRNNFSWELKKYNYRIHNLDNNLIVKMTKNNFHTYFGYAPFSRIFRR